jgi:hypothetical protein
MMSRDGSYYRIIEDFSKQAVNLSRYDVNTKDFTLLHKDWDSATTFMSELTTGVPEADFAKLFVFRRDHYVGRPEPSVSLPTPRSQPIKHAAPAGRRSVADENRLAELRKTLAKAEEAADAEYKAQSAKLALDELRKKLSSLDEIEQKKNELDSTLADLKACESLPQNLTDIIETHERQKGQKTVEIEELNKQVEGLSFQLAGIVSANLTKDPFFIAGACLLVLSILAPFLVPVAYASYFPLGILAACGLMGGVWYNSARKNAHRKAVQKDMESIEKERAEIEKRVEQENAPLRSYMKAVGAASAAELKDKADNYRYFLSMREDIEEQHTRMLNDSTPEILRQEYNNRQQEALELEKAARAVAQYNIDTYAIRQDIERIEASSSPTPSWDFGMEAPSGVEEFSAPAGGDRFVGFHMELDSASRIGGIEMETLIPAVEAAAQRNLTAITGGKYVRIEVDQNGRWPIVHARDESTVRYEDQSHGTRELIYFCLRVGLVEALVGKLRMPVLLDDPLTGFDAARQKAACQMLRTLGAKTQVILFTSNPALKTAGDAVLELK